MPDNPGAWIARVARNKALDRIRRSRTLAEKVAILEQLESLQPSQEPGPETAALAAEGIPDDRLRLLFICAHPTLAVEARVALTLKLLGGLTTAEVARAFLVTETTMAQRLVRAKRKIAGAGIPYAVPDAEQLPERLSGGVGDDLPHLQRGYLATSAEAAIRREPGDEAIRLGRVLVELMPREAEAKGLLALMLLTDAAGRRVSTTPATWFARGPGSWPLDRAKIAEGLALP